MFKDLMVRANFVFTLMENYDISKIYFNSMHDMLLHFKIQGMTPLMLAASRSNMSSLVETFLNYEADPNAKDSRGFTALRLVLRFNYPTAKH